MKKKIIIKSLFFLISFTSFADPQFANNGVVNLQKELQSLIDKNPHEVKLKSDIIARVEFTLNDKHELIILETDCSNKKIETYIKQTLNYRVIKKGNLDPKFQKCVIPLRFRKGNM